MSAIEGRIASWQDSFPHMKGDPSPKQQSAAVRVFDVLSARIAEHPKAGIDPRNGSCWLETRRRRGVGIVILRTTVVPPRNDGGRITYLEMDEAGIGTGVSEYAHGSDAVTRLDIHLASSRAKPIILEEIGDDEDLGPILYAQALDTMHAGSAVTTEMALGMNKRPVYPNEMRRLAGVHGVLLED